MIRILSLLFSIFFAAIATIAGAQARIGPEPGVHPYPVPPEVTIEPVPPWCAPITVALWTDKRNYAEGEDVSIYIRPSEDAYLYVFSTDTREDTRQVFPNAYDGNNFTRAHQLVRLPSSRYRLVTSGSGWDTIHVMAVAAYPGWVPPRTFERYSSSNPFPRVSGGVDSAREKLQGSLPRSGGGGGTFQNSPDQGNAGDSFSREGTIEPRPRDPAVDRRCRWGEAWTQIYVTPRGGIPDGYYGNPYVPHGNPYYPGSGSGSGTKTGTLRITSSPTRADVYIDNFYYGRTPIEVKLPEGRYDVEVYMPGYKVWVDRIAVHEGKRASTSVRLERRR